MADSSSDMASSTSIEFPLTHYYELEGRVHTDQWSIPYKRDESLAICMIATTRMVIEGRKQNLSIAAPPLNSSLLSLYIF